MDSAGEGVSDDERYQPLLPDSQSARNKTSASSRGRAFPSTSGHQHHDDGDREGMIGGGPLSSSRQESSLRPRSRPSAASVLRLLTYSKQENCPESSYRFSSSMPNEHPTMYPTGGGGASPGAGIFGFGEDEMDSGSESDDNENLYAATEDPIELHTSRTPRNGRVMGTPTIKDVVAMSRRTTLLSKGAQKDLKRTAPEAFDFLTSWWGVLIQMAVFALCVNIQALTPNVGSYAKYIPETGKKGQPFFDGVVMACANLLSLIGMITISSIADGYEGFRACFSISEIITMAPPALLYGMGDCLQLISLSYADPALVQIISQSKMVLTAVLCRFVLSRPLTAVQWFLLVTMSLDLYAYVRIDLLFDSASEVNDGTVTSSVNQQMVGIGLLLLRVVLTTPGGVLSDHLFKKTRRPFYIQLAQTMFSTFTASCFITFLQFWEGNLWDKGVFGGIDCGEAEHCGWTPRVYFLVVWYALRTGVNCLLMKRLDCVWKGIADTVATLFVYIYAIAFFGERTGKGGELKVTLILSIIVVVISYVLTKLPGAPVTDPHMKPQTPGTSPALLPPSSPQKSMYDTAPINPTVGRGMAGTGDARTYHPRHPPSLAQSIAEGAKRSGKGGVHINEEGVSEGAPRLSPSSPAAPFNGR